MEAFNEKPQNKKAMVLAPDFLVYSGSSIALAITGAAAVRFSFRRLESCPAILQQDLLRMPQLEREERRPQP
jgi:hypothetical protein